MNTNTNEGGNLAEKIQVAFLVASQATTTPEKYLKWRNIADSWSYEEWDAVLTLYSWIDAQRKDNRNRGY